MSKKVGRYKIEQNIPTKPELSEAEQAELEEFISNIKILTTTLGHKIFEDLDETIDNQGSNQQIFYCRNGSGANSQGTPSTEGFIVFQGSLFMISEQGSMLEGIRVERQRMLKEGILQQEGQFYKLTRDYIFNSASRAATAVLGRSASGPLEWKTLSGTPLKQLIE